MPRNVEIKARLQAPEAVHEAARALADGPPEIIEQHDVFFKSDTGRLKLRYLDPNLGQLIFYQRDDEAGPKPSTYHLVETGQPDQLRTVLANAYGETIEVRKQRHLYLTGRTRIHIDEVEGLGDFLELEVMLQEFETAETGIAEAIRLMERLGVAQSSLVEGAYADLLARDHL